jgi:hypothetical protein
MTSRFETPFDGNLTLEYEFDNCLTRLINHFQEDFDKIAPAFRQYLYFLSYMYPQQFKAINIEEYSPSVCQARYSHICKKNTEKPPASKAESKRKALQNEREWTTIGDHKPSDHNIFEHSLQQEFQKIYDKVRSSLPTIDDNEYNSEEVEEIFKTNMPPPSEFEKNLFSKDDFWNMHEYASSKESMNEKIMDSSSVDYFSHEETPISEPKKKTQQQPPRPIKTPRLRKERLSRVIEHSDDEISDD